MATWSTFVQQAPALSSYMRERLADDVTGRLSYLATTKADGGPRVHPVKVFGEGDHLYVFMWSGSPKGADLTRDGRFALHAAVTPNPFDSGELAAQGVAERTTDAAEYARAAAAAPFAKEPGADSLLFRLGLTLVVASLAKNDVPVRLRWREQDGAEEELPFPSAS